MKSLQFIPDSTASLLADVNAMSDFLEIVRTPDMDAVRGELRLRLSDARESLLESEVASRSPPWWLVMGGAFGIALLGAAFTGGARARTGPRRVRVR